ncbi:MAG: hypothetical protein ACJAVI_001337 [Candidatus Azotimanducaceae bacterium]|jgi:hypothetical protein
MANFVAIGNVDMGAAGLLGLNLSSLMCFMEIMEASEI